jgi:hypothetical protein
MAVEFELDTVQRVVRSRAMGATNDAEFREHRQRITQLFEEGTLDATWVQLIDVSAVDTVDALSSPGLRQMAALNPWPKESRRAILATTTVSFGLGRMYQMACGDKGKNVRVCRTMAEALAWIGRSAE